MPFRLFRALLSGSRDDMVLISPGPGKSLKTSLGRSASYKLLWVSRELDGEGRPLRQREPSGQRFSFPVKRGFIAAGRRYGHIRQLRRKVVRDCGFKCDLCRDVYGREVLYIIERFPCFDSYDYLYDNRCERWFLICSGGALTRVKYTDGTDYVEVWEDPPELEFNLWEQMLSLGWHAQRGDGNG